MTVLKNPPKTIAWLGAPSAMVVGIGAWIAPSYVYLFGFIVGSRATWSRARAAGTW